MKLHKYVFRTTPVAAGIAFLVVALLLAYAQQNQGTELTTARDE